VGGELEGQGGGGGGGGGVLGGEVLGGEGGFEVLEAAGGEDWAVFEEMGLGLGLTDQGGFHLGEDILQGGTFHFICIVS
jgi:hypothetical protein